MSQISQCSLIDFTLVLISLLNETLLLNATILISSYQTSSNLTFFFYRVCVNYEDFYKNFISATIDIVCAG